MSSVVSTRELTVSYGRVRAIDDVTIDVPAGSSVAVIGPNGCGKSTLLKTLAGIVEPSAGSFDVGGTPPAMVMQSTDVDEAVPISVRDVVAMARFATLGLLKRFTPSDWAAVDGAMRRVGVDELSNRQIHHLSGGQRQRALVAQGLAQDSPLLLLDEPLTGLDVASRSIILDVLDEEHLSGRTTIMTTHNFQDAQRCDLVLLLASRAVAFGPPSVVLTESHLHEAFGGRFVRIGDTLLLDDPHHDHAH